MLFSKKVALPFILSLAVVASASARAEDGVTMSEITFGQSAALDGPASALGVGMQLGLKAAFEEVNKAGGIGGKKLVLKSIDDGYEPDRSIANTNTLISTDKVFAIIGAVGTPTSKAMEAITTPAKVPLIGPFTGAGFLRSPHNRYVVNVRASYGEEGEMWVKHLTEDLGAKKIAIMYQDDAFGQAGLASLKAAMDKRGLAIAAQGTFERNTIAVKQAALDIQEGEPDAIVTVAPYKPTAEFIRTIKAMGMSMPVVSISFVGSEALAKDVGADGAGTFVTQVMPLPTDSTIPFVKAYQDALKAVDPAATPSYVSIEGYMVGRVTAEALKKVSGDVTREAFLDAVAGLTELDLGGVKLAYGTADNQGMDKVYLSRLTADGKFEQVESMK